MSTTTSGSSGTTRRRVVIDAAHDAEAILAALGGRTLKAIVCTHAHNDHIDAAPALAEATGAPVLLHPADLPLWKQTHPDRPPDGELSDGERVLIADVDLEVLHTPGHAPAAVCLYAPALGTVFTGDTLFAGGPGATGRSFSRLPDDHRLDQRAVADATAGDDVSARATATPRRWARRRRALGEWVARGH